MLFDFHFRYTSKAYQDRRDRVASILAALLYGAGDYFPPIIPGVGKYVRLFNVDLRETKLHTHVTVTLDRPGIFIGKAGVTITEIEKHLTQSLEKPVIIHLIEADTYLMKQPKPKLLTLRW